MAKPDKNTETRVTTKVVPALKAPRWIQGFVDFIREQGVVGLAVGLILGLGSKSVVDSLVANILNPIIGVLIGGDSLAHRYVCLKETNGVCTSRLGYGDFLSDVLSFIVIAAVVYFVVKGLKLDRLDKPKAEEE